MNKTISIVFLVIFLLTSLPLVMGATDAVENISDALFLPLIEVVRPLFVKLSFVVGGIFGATVFLIFARVYYDRKTVKLLKAIKFDLDQMNKHAGIRYSYEPGGFYQRLIAYLEDRAHRKALKQLHKMKRKHADLHLSKNKTKLAARLSNSKP